MVIGPLRRPGPSIPLVILRTYSLMKTVKILSILSYWTVLFSATFFAQIKIVRSFLQVLNGAFRKSFLIGKVTIDLHKEFSTGRCSRGVWIGRIKDVTIWCVPRMVATQPRKIFLESLVEVEQRPRHDNIVIH